MYIALAMATDMRPQHEFISVTTATSTVCMVTLRMRTYMGRPRKAVLKHRPNTHVRYIGNMRCGVTRNDMATVATAKMATEMVVTMERQAFDGPHEGGVGEDGNGVFGGCSDVVVERG